MRSTLHLRQHVKRFLTISSISLALVVGTSVLAFAADKDSGKGSPSGGQDKQSTLSSLRQMDNGAKDRGKVDKADETRFGATTNDKYDSEELEFLEIINKYRQDKGVGALVLSDALALASERHSKDMGRYNFFAHDTAKSSYFPTGSRPWDRMTRSGYDYPNSSRAENLVAGHETAKKAFEAWRASPGHNRNMLDDDQKVIGIARVRVPGSKYGWYWTTDFGSEKDPTSHAPGETPSSKGQRTTGKGRVSE